MSMMGFMHADEALRLANERQAGLRQEAQLDRFRPTPRASGRGGGLRGAVARFGAALRELTVNPLPRLPSYSSRP